MKIILLIACSFLMVSTLAIGKPAVDQQNEDPLFGTWNLIPGNYSYQSFQTKAGNIVSAEVNVVGPSFTGVLTINLFDSIGGPILASGSTAIVALQTLTWVSVDFGNSVELGSNTTYYLGVAANSDNVRLGVSVDYSFPHGYEYGSAYYSSGGDSVVGDYLFRTIANVHRPFPWPIFIPAIIGAGK